MGLKTVGIVGVNGYVGSELARLVLSHPNLSLQMACSRRNAGQPLGAVLPPLEGFSDVVVEAPDWEKLSSLDVVFLATPHGVSKGFMAELESFSPKMIVDMSADHRHA